MVCLESTITSLFSVAKSSLTLCNPMDCSMPGFPVLYHLPEFAQIHVHWVSDAYLTISSSAPLSFALNYQAVFQWVSFSHQVAKGFQLQHQFFQQIFKLDFLFGWTGLISLQSKGLSGIFSNTTVQKHQFFGAQLSSQSNPQHPYMTTGKTITLTRQTDLGWQSNVSAFENAI